MAFFDSLIGLVTVILIFGLPVIAVVMGALLKMHRSKHEREIRQLIIENHTDPETAKLLIDEPKKQPKERKPGSIDLGTLRTACIMLGIGFGALINWCLRSNSEGIYFWILIAFGIGIGLLCSFLVEMYLYKKYGDLKKKEENGTESAKTKNDK